MGETFGKNDCGRAEQLVGYLYGEAGAGERAEFDRHLRDCAACRDELAAYGHVRSSVADFRAELLRAAPTVSLESFAAETTVAQPAATAPHASTGAASGSRASADLAQPVATPRPSAAAAWAALREFFRLSPAWLRASTVAATLALCALALLAVANAEVSFGDGRYAIRTGTRPAAQPAGAPAPSTRAAQPAELAALQSRLDSLAAERDAAVRELEDMREQLDDSRAANLVAAEFESVSETPRESSAAGDERGQRRPSSSPVRPNARTRNSRRASDDEELPRLLDLLGGAN